MLRPGSNGGFMRQPLVRLPVLGLVGLALWLAAELVAFAAAVYLIGFIGAVAACLLTSLAGLASLRRVGVAAAWRLRQAMTRREAEGSGLSRDVLLDGTLAGLGAVLLILPGFVSDFVGLALAAPSFRFWVAERLKVGRLGLQGIRAPALIELSPEEWSRGGPQLPP
jgi:UPF0716 protein FxsA